MPSFAKVASPLENPLANLWKDHPNASPLKSLVDDYRVRAAEILRTDIPAKITRVRHLMTLESDPTSPLWIGHTESGDYISPRMVQPDHIENLISPIPGHNALLTTDFKLGEKVVLPSELSLDRQSGGSTPSSEMSEDTLVEGAEYRKFARGLGGSSGAAGKGSQQVGPHWFEVIPRNPVQTSLVEMMVKEHEDLHLICTDLRLWLELEIPLIEDGNSFGAEIQNHLIREVDIAHKRSNAFHNGARQHHTDRLKLAVEWIRYPNALDYPAAIAQSDRFDHFLTRSYLRQLLVIYGGLMTKFQRNWEKVINPKGNTDTASGGIGMY